MHAQGPLQSRRLKVLRSSIAAFAVIFCCLIAFYLYFLSAVTSTPKVSAAAFNDRRIAEEKAKIIAPTVHSKTHNNNLRPAFPIANSLDYFVELSVFKGDHSESGKILVQVYTMTLNYDF